MENETLFSALVKTRIAMYELLDQGVMKDDEITSFEEEVLSRRGIDLQDYWDWKDNWVNSR